MIGVHGNSIANWERPGASPPKWDSIERLAKVLGVSTDYLLAKPVEELPVQPSDLAPAALRDEESELLNAIRAMPPEDRKVVYRLARALGKESAERQPRGANLAEQLAHRLVDQKEAAKKKRRGPPAPGAPVDG